MTMSFVNDDGGFTNVSFKRKSFFNFRLKGYINGRKQKNNLKEEIAC